jgi:hypothetical protein
VSRYTFSMFTETSLHPVCKWVRWRTVTIVLLPSERETVIPDMERRKRHPVDGKSKLSRSVYRRVSKTAKSDY